MPKQGPPTYSRLTQNAAVLMGKQIRLRRKELKMTVQELAERAGISRGLVQRIEKGDLKCQLGAVFEVATIVGIKLFDANERQLHDQIKQTEKQIILLPKHIHSEKRQVDDDF